MHNPPLAAGSAPLAATLFRLTIIYIVAAIHPGELAFATNCVALIGGMNPPCARYFRKCKRQGLYAPFVWAHSSHIRTI